MHVHCCVSQLAPCAFHSYFNARTCKFPLAFLDGTHVPLQVNMDVGTQL